MSKHTKIVKECRYFQLLHKKRDNKSWYEVKIDKWRINAFDMGEGLGFSTVNEIKDYFDPNHNKTFGDGTFWRFWNRTEAEQQYLYAVMRWNRQ